MSSFWPNAPAATCISSVSLSVPAFFGFTRKAMASALGINSCRSSNCFCPSCLLKNTAPVALPSGLFKACNQAELDRIAAREEDDWSSRCCCFDCKGSGDTSGHEHRYWMANQFGRQRWQSLVAPLRPTIFDNDVAALDETGIAEAAPEVLD